MPVAVVLAAQPLRDVQVQTSAGICVQINTSILAKCVKSETKSVGGGGVAAEKYFIQYRLNYMSTNMAVSISWLSFNARTHTSVCLLVI